MLSGVTVAEFASENAAFAGKLLAGMGAQVILIEPPGGHYSRLFEPFAHDRKDPERSLWWWHYNTGKQSVILDPVPEKQRLVDLLTSVDIVLEGFTSLRHQQGGVTYEEMAPIAPGLIWVSVTPFGRDLPRSDEEATDLTVLASGGPVWSSGYDDHSLPPVRGGGNQGYQTASIWAVMGALAALSYRDAGGPGQRVDVSMHAAANVTTEQGSYGWLVRQATMQRQTGRHASAQPTGESIATAKDGRAVSTGVPPRTGREFQILVDWMSDLGLLDDFDDAVFLHMGAQQTQVDMALIGVDPEVTAIFGAGRDATVRIAEQLDAYEFFVQGQRRGLTCAIVYAPEEILEDVHFRDRGLFVDVEHEDLGQTFRYVGSPFVASNSAFEVSRAPHLGEHNADADG